MGGVKNRPSNEVITMMNGELKCEIQSLGNGYEKGIDTRFAANKEEEPPEASRCLVPYLWCCWVVGSMMVDSRVIELERVGE